LLKPIGIVKTAALDDEITESDDSIESTIEISQEFSEGLEGIEGFSHIFVLTYLHRHSSDEPDILKIRPLRLLKKGFKLEQLPFVGVFATSSASRPNPIGLSVVRLLRREENKLIVRGLDCYDGTPVLDIKPYKDDYRADDYGVAAWYHRLINKTTEGY